MHIPAACTFISCLIVPHYMPSYIPTIIAQFSAHCSLMLVEMVSGLHHSTHEHFLLIRVAAWQSQNGRWPMGDVMKSGGPTSLRLHRMRYARSFNTVMARWFSFATKWKGATRKEDEMRGSSRSTRKVPSPKRDVLADECYWLTTNVSRFVYSSRVLSP